MILTILCVIAYCHLRLKSTNNFVLYGVLLPLFMPVSLRVLTRALEKMQASQTDILPAVDWSNPFLSGLIAMSCVVVLFLVRSDVSSQESEEEDIRNFNRILAFERKEELRAQEEVEFAQHNAASTPLKRRRSLQEMVKNSK